MKNFSPEALRALFSPETDKVFYLLLDIDPDTEGKEKVYIYNAVEYENGEPRVITHGGNKYVACAFNIDLPSEGDGTQSEITLTVANVDRALTDVVREQSRPFLVEMKIVMSDEPERLEAGPWKMKLINATVDALSVEGTLIIDRFLDEPYPYDKFDRSNFFM